MDQIEQHLGLDLVWVPIAPFYYWLMLEVTFNTICKHIPFHYYPEQLTDNNHADYLNNILPALLQIGDDKMIEDDGVVWEGYSD